MLHNPTIIESKARILESRLNQSEPTQNSETKFEKVKSTILNRQNSQDLLPSYKELNEEHISSPNSINPQIPIVVYPESNFLHPPKDSAEQNENPENTEYLNLKQIFQEPYIDRNMTIVEARGTDTKVNDGFLNHLNEIFTLKA